MSPPRSPRPSTFPASSSFFPRDARRSEAREIVASSLRGALALVSPVECAGCGSADRELCPACRERLRPSPLGDALPDGTPVVSALDYSGVVRDVILAFKQEGRWRLSRALGPALARALELARSFELAGALELAQGSHPRQRGGSAVLVAVPSSARGRRQRGYEPVELLLSAVGERPVRGGLRLVRASGSQKGRSRADRARAREGSLRASPRLSGHDVIVVDDVTTTGSTLVEAVRALEAAGAHVAAACCLAATPLLAAKSPSASAEPTRSRV